MAQRGESALDPSEPVGITPEQIIQKFAAKEKEFSKAREDYTYRQDVLIQTIDGNTPNGEYHQVVDVTFDDKNRRRENVVFSPQPDLKDVSLDPEDFEDINHLSPFVLTTDELPLYQVLYVGKQKIDEVGTYVFDIAPIPAKMEKGKRYFQGRAWVDDQDMQIVKSEGKAAFVAEKRLEGHMFSTYTTWREQIDGKYWFPTYSLSDEVIHFPGTKRQPPSDAHIRIKIKFTDYKRFGSKSRVIFNGEEVKNDQNQPPQNPPKK
jgi:hypothetical protein